MAETFKLGNTKWGVKEGSLLAYNDENNNFKPLPFDFTRASTSTRVNEDGLIEVVKSGIPRIDYTDNPSGHLLLEPLRRNIIPYSQDINLWSDFAQGSGVAPITTANYAISPDGTQNAERLQCNQGVLGGANRSGKAINVSVVNGATYSFSVWVKSNTGTNQNFSFLNNFANLTSGTSQHVATTEWQRFSNVGASVVTGSGQVWIGMFGNTLSTTNDILVWGAQCEDAGAGVSATYATSYIPTDGTTETRVAETCTGAGNAQVFNDSEGVLFANVAKLTNGSYTSRFGISDGTSSNRIKYTLTNTASSNQVYIQGSSIYTISFTQVQDSFIKTAFKYDALENSIFVNGTKVATRTSPLVISTFSGIDVFNFNNSVGGDPFYGKIKQIGVYDTALTDDELETLTT